MKHIEKRYLQKKSTDDTNDEYDVRVLSVAFAGDAGWRLINEDGGEYAAGAEVSMYVRVYDNEMGFAFCINGLRLKPNL